MNRQPPIARTDVELPALRVAVVPSQGLLRQGRPVRSHTDAARVLAPYFTMQHPARRLAGALTDNQDRLMAVALIDGPDESACCVRPGDMCEPLILAGATRAWFAHCHPSFHLWLDRHDVVSIDRAQSLANELGLQVHAPDGSTDWVAGLLDARSRLFAVALLNRTGRWSCVVAPAEVYRAVLVLGARSVYLAHAHDRGGAPSNVDCHSAAKVHAMGHSLGHELVDVLVFDQRRDYLSLRSLGLAVPIWRRALDTGVLDQPVKAMRAHQANVNRRPVRRQCPSSRPPTPDASAQQLTRGSPRTPTTTSDRIARDAAPLAETHQHEPAPHAVDHAPKETADDPAD